MMMMMSLLESETRPLGQSQNPPRPSLGGRAAPQPMGGAAPEARRDPRAAERQRSSVGEEDHGSPGKAVPQDAQQDQEGQGESRGGRGAAARRGAAGGAAVTTAWPAASDFSPCCDGGEPDSEGLTGRVRLPSRAAGRRGLQMPTDAL